MGGKFQGELFSPLDESRSVVQLACPPPSPLLTLPRLQICPCEKVAFLNERHLPLNWPETIRELCWARERQDECEAFPKEVDDGGQAGRYTECWRHQPEALGSQWGWLKHAAACARTLWHDGRVILFMK